ncbi:heavy metal translocating P-type ATPase [Halochromatium glycolicum]|uniref:P-type Zn(2+) transporter n=1 Tax=Halochromatium glycolicum TaxID=85075 RepID=A0AAJ0XBA2_9GAMM|nr:heavy metal translocating P-type ATPase [Halochromatium glycolicum]MBK1706596.1 heavy metal translocating P-type ATPase [Halochromatium glycolicum]
MSNYRIVHEVPGRLRLRIPALGEPGCEAGALEDWMDAAAPVQEVRANRSARTLIIRYRGGDDARAALLRRLERFSSEPIPGYSEDGVREAEVAPMITTLFTLAMLPLLTPPLRVVLTFANVGSTLAKGADTLVHEGIKVEVLDALAVGLAAANGKLFTANVTDLLLDFGEFLERRTQRQSDRLLRRLLRPDPAMAWVERDGELVQISGDEVRLGETVVVGVGETVPVDGHVLDGLALVNQASVTGEDVPVRKEAPARVIAGSVLVEGRLRLEATRVGEDTTTARVSRFIQASLAEQAATQRVADELADKRVYLTLGTGAVVYALTRDLARLQSVFLVDYSCALKLGTPVAFKSGMARAAEHGVLMKGGEAIEALAEVDTLVFDKTGTLTHSDLLVTDVVVLPAGCECSETELLAMVASVEEHASHPVAQAVVEAARERDLAHISHGEVDYMVAHGLQAEVDGGRIVVGSRHYLEEHMAIGFEAHQARIDALEAEGKTLLFVGNAEGAVGLIALRDTLREEAPAALARLRALGIERLIMITGDRREKAEALAAELGLDAVHAEMAPEDKAGVIESLQQAGRKVAFVGDGVNDGPALSVANLGIAMPRGADIARATADVVLMDDRLLAVADARELAAKTMRLIQHNFHAAVGVNTGVLAGAVLGWLSPVASAVLHNGSTIGILVNALKGVSLDAEPDAPVRAQMRAQVRALEQVIEAD